MKRLACLKILLIIIVFMTNVKAFAGSGGELSPDQAAYDVNYYDLNLTINPDSKTIGGSLLCRVKIINLINTLVLDLDNRFTIDSILFKKETGEFLITSFNHSGGKVNIIIPQPVAVSDLVSVKIFYNGTPRSALNPPWDPGFVWRTTSGGKPWIGVACEDEGADIWWPCKDHPSDEPDSMSLSFTVPNPLICVSNGRFLGRTDNGNNTSTFNWFISTPINNYNVTIYIAEYSLIEEEYLSVTGETIPFYFWVLPEFYNTAVDHMSVFRNEFNFLEFICGPFPFGSDKHGWAHAPYWGMEHQTIVAYGHDFSLNNWGYDYIHYHELAHEWWGNLITAKDWSDVWIHEGLATYTEALYVEHLYGKNSYHQFMDARRPQNNHMRALAPRESMTAGQSFDLLNPYYRGASVMHTLRYHLGDAAFFNVLKRWAYSDSTDLDNTNGRLCRILSTDDMKNQAEEVTGVELDPFFDVFFREASYPVLKVTRGTDNASFSWSTKNNIPLDVNIPIRVNNSSQTVEIINGQGSAAISLNDNLVIDPKKWILMAAPVIITGNDDLSKHFDYKLEQNYPNPFNPTTTISYSIPEGQVVELRLYNLLGNEVAVLVNDYRQAGNHSVEFDAGELSSGIYFYKLKAGKFIQTKKLILLQ